jgi:hypothetical protein
MNSRPSENPRRVLAKLAWVRTGSGEMPDAGLDWQTAAAELFNALDEALGQLDAAGLCRGCGKPLGSYCLECAWPHKRRSERLG